MGILQFLNTRGDPQDQHHIVRMRDFFVYSSHLCIAFELLSINLYELIKMNHFRGLSTGLVRVFVEQVCSSVIFSQQKCVPADDCVPLTCDLCTSTQNTSKQTAARDLDMYLVLKLFLDWLGKAAF